MSGGTVETAAARDGVGTRAGGGGMAAARFFEPLPLPLPRTMASSDGAGSGGMDDPDGTLSGVPLANPPLDVRGFPSYTSATSFAVSPSSPKTTSSSTHSAACRSSFFVNKYLTSSFAMFTLPSVAMYTIIRKNGSISAFLYQYPPSENVSPYVSTRNRSNALR